jgi:hypothetical protein
MGGLSRGYGAGYKTIWSLRIAMKRLLSSDYASPSGPTNLRSPGMIGSDRGGTVLSRNPWKNRDAGLELAYNLRSLTIAEDRGQPDISGVTSGVTFNAQFELPRRCAALTPKIGVKTALCSRRLTAPDLNSISRAALPNWPPTSRLSSHD